MVPHTLAGGSIGLNIGAAFGVLTNYGLELAIGGPLPSTVEGAITTVVIAAVTVAGVWIGSKWAPIAALLPPTN